MIKVRKDLTGMLFGRLEVLYQTDDYVYHNGNRLAIWHCRCSCESHNEVDVTGINLKSGCTKSCGCLKNETSIKNGKSNKKYNTYNLSGDYGIGRTLKGEEFYFDLEDYDKIKDYCWHKSKDGYLKAQKYKKIIRMHRIIMDCSQDMVIDHINHNKSDNRKYNLRICTNQQNQMNKSLQSNNTSGYTGIYWHKKSNKWCAYIKVNNKRIHLGCFSNIEEAIKIREEAEIKYFGEFRNLNYKKECFND